MASSELKGARVGMDCLGGVAKPTLGTPADRSRRAFVAAEATVLSLARDGNIRLTVGIVAY